MANRMYPAYTTKQLKEIVAVGNLSDDMTAQINAEIAAREAGLSVTKITPQIEGGMVQAKVGRL
jgi:hypothetical protein